MATLRQIEQQLADILAQQGRAAPDARPGTPCGLSMEQARALAEPPNLEQLRTLLPMQDSADHTPAGARRRAGHFKPGESGNPKGRPRGSRNRTTMLAQAFAAEHADDLLKAAYALAVTGYTDVLRFLLERMFPKDWTPGPDFSLGTLDTAEDVRAASDRVMQAHTAGELTAAEVDKLHSVLDARLTMVKSTTFPTPAAEQPGAEPSAEAGPEPTAQPSAPSA